MDAPTREHHDTEITPAQRVLSLGCGRCGTCSGTSPAGRRTVWRPCRPSTLVLNDGWGPDATHTKSPLAWPAAGELERIEHPPCVVRNVRADAITFDRNFGGAQLRAMDSPRARFQRRIDPLLGLARGVKRALNRMMPRRQATG